jgi:hypothetical protein
MFIEIDVIPMKGRYEEIGAKELSLVAPPNAK